MRNKKSVRRKKGIIIETDKVVSLAKYVNDFTDIKKAVPVFCATAIGSIEGKSFTDKLAMPPKTYKLYESPLAAKKALINGELKVGEAYCCSYYEYDKIFPGLSKKETKEEAILYLKELNENGMFCFSWTFLDDEEKQKVNDKIIGTKRQY